MIKFVPTVMQFNLGHEGACGEGDVISDVQLPPWASSAHDFVRTHREVSCTYLHVATTQCMVLVVPSGKIMP